MKKFLTLCLLALVALWKFGGSIELPKSYSLNAHQNASLVEILGEIE